MIKKTPEVKTEPSVIDIHSNTFIGVQYDPATVAAMNNIADAVSDGFAVLRTLAEVVRASNVNIQTMLNVEKQ